MLPALLALTPIASALPSHGAPGDLDSIEFCPTYNPNAFLNACLAAGTRWQPTTVSTPHPTTGWTDTCVIGHLGCLPFVDPGWRGETYVIPVAYVDGWIEPTIIGRVHTHTL